MNNLNTIGSVIIISYKTLQINKKIKYYEYNYFTIRYNTIDYFLNRLVILPMKLSVSQHSKILVDHFTQ